MVKKLNLICNYSKSVRPSIWCRNALVTNRQGELTSLVPKRLGAERSRAESSKCAETSVNRQNVVAVISCRKESCPSDYLALSLLGCVIIVLRYTGAVTGTEPGDEFYTLPLEINIVAFQPFNSNFMFFLNLII